MKLKPLLIITLAASLFATTAHAQNATNNDTEVQELKQEIQQMEQKVDVLEYQQEKEQKTVSFVATNSARLTVGSDGINFVSANSNFVAALHGVIQVDSRTFFQNGNTPGIDGFLLRRARVILRGPSIKISTIISRQSSPAAAPRKFWTLI